MLKINDDWEVQKDSFGWQVHHWREGKSTRTGEMKRTKATSYYPRLEQCLLHIMDEEADNAGDVEELMAFWLEMKAQIIAAVRRPQ